MVIVNTVAYDSFILLDNTGAPITGKVTADFATRLASLDSAPTTTASVTITEAGGALAGLGKYITAFTPSVVGTWSILVIYNVGGVSRTFTETYQVVTAAQADTLGALLSGYANSPGTAGKALQQIGSLSIAQLPLATGTGGAAVWTKQTP